MTLVGLIVLRLAPGEGWHEAVRVRKARGGGGRVVLFGGSSWSASDRAVAARQRGTYPGGAAKSITTAC